MKHKAKEDVQYIDCLDSKAIIFKKGEDKEEKITSLVIPLNKSIHNKSQEKLKEDVKKNEIHTAKIQTHTGGGDSMNRNSLDETAVKEILEDVKKSTEDTKNYNASAPQIPNLRHGTGDSEESTLEDYESIPVVDFGMAMLRGMGWNPGKGIGRNERVVTANMTEPRPRGVGLGADKLASLSVLSPIPQEDGEELKVIKGAYVQIISGSHRGQYGQIEGFNEDSGRVIVHLSRHSSPVSVNEAAFKLVTKEEFSKNSRVLNVSSYEEYKQKTDVSREVARHGKKRHAN
ncbi:hypothetical protein B7P43_G02629 [Cryptotermes secundus]|uniref:G-patch domain-containing protein n=1 Tax=Cryptotermes secundus TaxID=105785 RepID=A0A2J7PP65_9NEOP|nr:hypothetical protein B7P43_G02629 [Cryptotermes secundus]